MPRTKLQNTIIKLLQSGPLNTPELVFFAKQEAKTTQQGVYKALRKLRDAEIVTVHKKSVSLSLVWMDAELAKFREMTEAYQTRAQVYSFLRMKPGRRISFKYRTLRELHLFWVQVFLILESQSPATIPTYAITPHDWFYMQTTLDQVWSRRLEQSGRRLGGVVTHATSFDRNVVRAREASYVEYMFNKNPFGFDERHYMNIIGSWAIEAFIDSKVNQKLVAFVRKHGRKLPSDSDELFAIMDLPGHHVLKISHAPKRVEKMTRKLKKYFTF